MSIFDFIRRHSSENQLYKIDWAVDPDDGVDFVLSEKALSQPEAVAQENPLFGMCYAYLNELVNAGFAYKHANGFTVEHYAITEQGDEFAAMFGFPNKFDGVFKCKFTGSTGQSAFTVKVTVILPDGSEVSSPKLFGPFLQISQSEEFRLSPGQWHFLNGCYQHEQLEADDRDEYANNKLILELQKAVNAGVKADLAQFNNLEVSIPETIGINVAVEENGDLQLTPAFGSGINADDVNNRLGQIESEAESTVLRVGNKFVLLDKKRIEAAEEILTNRNIPKDQVTSFLKSPTAYLNAALIDFDTGFSLRVRGAARFQHHYFGDIEKSGVDWFSAIAEFPETPEKLTTVISDTEELEDVTKRIEDAWDNSSDSVSIGNKTFDIANKEKVHQALEKIANNIENGTSPIDKAVDTKEKSEKSVVDIASNDEELEFSVESKVSQDAINDESFSLANLKRSPFPHQDEGIKWLLAHFMATTDKGSGALLADDMGLGKTYMILVAISEWMSRNKQAGKPQKPILLVAPLSLMENWVAEVEETFISSPFSDIVILQSNADLSRFRIKGARPETKQLLEEDGYLSDQQKIRYSLKVSGAYGADRLDMPGRLVLTTYQTLRDYQFSLSRVDWQVVAFDEAQAIKNPNAMATVAAKGLKAEFKLLATGTPVENSLKDFWCLLDTAYPGLLGAWQSFRSAYISPILAAQEDNLQDIKIEIGKQLRMAVGLHMLRRTKAEKLEGLPEKNIFSGYPDDDSIYIETLAGTMKGAQLDSYNDIVDHVRNAEVEDKRKLILPSLHKLKITCIHHQLSGDFNSLLSGFDPEAIQSSSIKIASMIAVVDEIKRRGEKVLIFTTTKSVQSLVAALLMSRYGIEVNIINGETKAVPSKSDEKTRKAIVDDFQSRGGFGAIVMSPVAAGTGLTITGANNVIHLERHWNPAKEAQATDRVYRIGQKKAVNVYLPMALHPSIASFDVQLNALLSKKVDLSDAVVANNNAQADDFESVFK